MVQTFENYADKPTLVLISMVLHVSLLYRYGFNSTWMFFVFMSSTSALFASFQANLSLFRNLLFLGGVIIFHDPQATAMQAVSIFETCI